MDIRFFAKARRTVVGLAAVTTLLLSLAFTSLVSADSSHWAYDSIMTLVDHGVVDEQVDYEDYRGADNLNRAELAKMLYTALGYTSAEGVSSYYPEVPTWAGSAVDFLVSIGAIDAGNASYRASDPATKAEYAKMLSVAYGWSKSDSSMTEVYCTLYYDDCDASQWYAGYVAKLTEAAILQGNDQGMVEPSKNINRYEAFVMTARAMNAEATGGGTDPGNGNPTQGDTDGDGVLDVNDNCITEPNTSQLDSDGNGIGDACDKEETSDAGLTVAVVKQDDLSIPQDALDVSAMTITLTAGVEDSVVVYGFDVSHFSPSDATDKDIDDLRAVLDGEVIGNNVDFSGDDEVYLNLGKDKITIPAGDTVTLELHYSMSSSVESTSVEHYLRLESAAAVDTNAASVNGNFMLEGVKVFVTNSTIGGVTFESIGSATNVDVGDYEIIGEFKITNGSSTNSFAVKSIAFQNGGTANLGEACRNLVIVDKADVTVAGPIDPTDDDVTMKFSPSFVIKEGSNDRFQLKCDIVSGDQGETLDFEVNNRYDIVVNVDNSKTMYGVAVTLTDESLATYTLQAGDINFSLHKSSPVNSNVINQVDDFTLAVFNMDAAQAIELREFTLGITYGLRTTDGTTAVTACSDLTATLVNTKFDDVRLYTVNKKGQTVLFAGPLSGYTTAGTGSFSSPTCTLTDNKYNFDDDYNFGAGENLIIPTLDINSAASSNETIQATLIDTSSTTDFEIRYDDNTNKRVATTEITGNPDGPVMTIKAATLKVSEIAGYESAENLVRGATKYPFAKWSFYATETSDVTVETVVVTVTINGTADISDMTASGLYDNDGNLISKTDDVSSSTSTTGTVTFSGLNWKIAAGKDMKVTFKADLDSSATALGTYSASIAASTSISAYDIEDNDATITFEGGGSSAAGATFTVTDGATVTVEHSSNFSKGNSLVTATGECDADGNCYSKVAEVEVRAVDDDVILEDWTLTDGGSSLPSVYTGFALKEMPATGGAACSGAMVSTATMVTNSDTVGEVEFTSIEYAIKDNNTYRFEICAEIAKIKNITNTAAKISLYQAAAADLEVSSVSTKQTIGSSSITNSMSNGVSGNNQTSHRAYRSIPTFTKVNPSNTALIEGGDVEVFYFNIAANASSDVYISRVSLEVVSATSGVTLSDVYLYEIGSEATTDRLNGDQAGYVAGDTGDTDAITAETLTIDFDNPEAIAAGTTKKYVIKATVVDGVENSDTLNTANLTLRLAGGDSSAASLTRSAQSTASAKVIWTDGSNTDDPDSLTVASWANSWQLKKDVNSGSITFSNN